MLQMHGCFRFVNIVCVILVELRRLVRQLTILPALLTVLYPEQAQRNAALLHLTMYPLIIRHLVNWRCFL